MSIVAVGVTHHSAPLALLERLVIPLADRLRIVSGLLEREHLSEVLVLSTCNRTEVFGAAERFHGAYEDVRDLLAKEAGLDPTELDTHLVVRWEDEAVRHLMRVAAGLDSAVLGEHEILGQLREAVRESRSAGGLGPVLEGAVDRSLAAGRRARTETTIARHTTSVSHAAVELAGAALDGLAGRRVVVLGAGRMGRSMAQSAARSGAEVTVVNRSRDRARAVADEIGGRAAGLFDLADELGRADAVLAGSAAPGVLLGREEISQAMAARQGRGLLLVDIALPRDVDPAAAALAGVRLLDMDAVAERTGEALDRRAGEIGAVEDIVESELERWRSSTSARAAGPVVAALHDRADELRAAEIAKWRRRLDELDPEAAELVDHITRATLAKLLHEPSRRLRESGGSLRGERLAEAARDLFHLG